MPPPVPPFKYPRSFLHLAATHPHPHHCCVRSPLDTARPSPTTMSAPNPPSARPATLRHAASDSALPALRLPAALPECWGHRGASDAFPENTMASFDAAVRDGADGIETDVHITQDDVIVMFHDSVLGRTTNGSGNIADQPYAGGIDQVRTVEQPVQKIPTFNELCDFLMRPENRHVKANIDVKPDNQPERLFRLMKHVVSQHDSYETDLAPRLVLGLWHPKFIAPAIAHVPDLRRIHIGGSPSKARKYFWDGCDGFSMSFASLVGAEGQRFLRDAQADGKDVLVWTVNRPDEMVEATHWGVKAVLTDNTDLFQRLRHEMEHDFAKIYERNVPALFRWTTWQYYAVPQFLIQRDWHADAERRAGETFDQADERRSRSSNTSPAPSESEDTAVGTPLSKAASGADLPAPSVAPLAV